MHNKKMWKKNSYDNATCIIFLKVWCDSMVQGSIMKTIRRFNIRKIDNWKKLAVVFMKSITYPYVAVRRWSKIKVLVKKLSVL